MQAGSGSVCTSILAVRWLNPCTIAASQSWASGVVMMACKPGARRRKAETRGPPVTLDRARRDLQAPDPIPGALRSEQRMGGDDPDVTGQAAQHDGFRNHPHRPHIRHECFRPEGRPESRDHVCQATDPHCQHDEEHPAASAKLRSQLKLRSQRVFAWSNR